MFASRFLLHQNWLNGKCNVRTLEGHTQGKFSIPVNFFKWGSCRPFEESPIQCVSIDPLGVGEGVMRAHMFACSGTMFL